MRSDRIREYLVAVSLFYHHSVRENQNLLAVPGDQVHVMAYDQQPDLSVESGSLQQVHDRAVPASSAEVISSQISTSGSAASALAIATR